MLAYMCAGGGQGRLDPPVLKFCGPTPAGFSDPTHLKFSADLPEKRWAKGPSHLWNLFDNQKDPFENTYFYRQILPIDRVTVKKKSSSLYQNSM